MSPRIEDYALVVNEQGQVLLVDAAPSMRCLLAGYDSGV